MAVSNNWALVESLKFCISLPRVKVSCLVVQPLRENFWKVKDADSIICWKDLFMYTTDPHIA